MADLSLVTENYLATASETFADNLSGSITAGAVTVPVNSAAEYADGDVVVLTVEPGTANEATFVGVKDVGADQFIDCIWTEGNTAVGHDAGATIIDYDSATHYNLLSEAMQLIMNQDGTLKDDPIRTALGLSDASNDGWEVFPYTFTVSSGYNKGQNEYDLTVANQNVTSLLSPGMRLRLERSTTAPTQCADFESSSSQYASKATPAGITFTDDFTAEAWVKPEAHTAAAATIIARRNASTDGFQFRLEANGQVSIFGLRIAANNRIVSSVYSLSMGKWSHVAASMDNSANSHAIYINGVSVNVTNTTTGTITAIVQQAATPLVVGAYATGTEPFDGKMCEVRLWSAVRTATEIRDNMNQVLVGNETNLVAYFPFNGNFEDSTANNNDLTASGGVIATNTDNPFLDTQYAIVTKVAYSAPHTTVTVTTGNAHLIPNMTLNSPHYSVQKVPYGFPAGKNKWFFEAISYNLSVITLGTSYTAPSYAEKLAVPTGAWDVSLQCLGRIDSAAASTRTAVGTLSSDGSTETNKSLTFCVGRDGESATTANAYANISVADSVEVSTQTNFSLLCKVPNTANVTSTNIDGDNEQATLIRAECAYL